MENIQGKDDKNHIFVTDFPEEDEVNNDIRYNHDLLVKNDVNQLKRINLNKNNNYFGNNNIHNNNNNNQQQQQQQIKKNGKYINNYFKDNLNINEILKRYKKRWKF